ncbi:hypothetical protein [Xanthovirga aplysinae]|uniref:hypothetical protein n=1 Tax=Xanthovirga aplysinae TaxID=2529853 RepID=UPI0012BBA0FF|nr:hypothetical protein [Xanthovirga aplysinae]MTI32150.1 hypothetical protein [Xanthovirga aplysinae]
MKLLSNTFKIMVLLMVGLLLKLSMYNQMGNVKVMANIDETGATLSYFISNEKSYLELQLCFFCEDNPFVNLNFQRKNNVSFRFFNHPSSFNDKSSFCENKFIGNGDADLFKIYPNLNTCQKMEDYFIYQKECSLFRKGKIRIPLF